MRDGEAGLVALAVVYSFALMTCNSVLKPFRDALGTTTHGLSQLWTGTFVTCLLLLVPYWALVARFSRRQFVPWVHRFFSVVFVVAWWLLRDEKHVPIPIDVAWVASGFYWTVSVFNLFVISQMWGLLADVFRREQSERLFAPIAAGGTIGALVGSAVANAGTAWLARHAIGPAGLVWVAIVLLEVATLCAVRLALRTPTSSWRPPEPGGTIGRHLHSIFEGAKQLVRSPYLLAIAAYMFVSNFTYGAVYELQRNLLKVDLPDRARQTEYLASVYLWTNLLALCGQLVVSRWLLRRAGLATTLSVIHVVGLVGLVAFGVVARPAAGDPPVVPSATTLLYVVSTVAIAIKAVDYSLAKPARESLFTVMSRAEKYQSKSLIDAGLYRGFDMVDSWAYDALRLKGALGLGLVGLGLPFSTFAFVVAPFSLLGVWTSRRLAREQAKRPEATG